MMTLDARGDEPVTTSEPTIGLMPALSYLLLVALLAYSGMQMMLGGALDTSYHIVIGPIDVYLFDVLLLAAVTILVADSLFERTAPLPHADRAIIATVLVYCAYQLAIVLPIAVVGYDLSPISVFREIEERLGLMLLPFMCLVVLKYIPVRRVILFVNITAVAVAVYAMYTYATVGADFSVGKFRAVDGHASFLFAFLILTSVFLWRPGVVSYGAAVLGLIGIVLANHRSAYLALIVVAVPLLFRIRRASARTAVIVVVALSAAVLVVSASPAVRDSVFYSLETMVNPSADQNTLDRVDRAKLGWEYFLAHPLGDHVWNQRYYLVDVGWAFEPHNFIVQILNAQGIIGFTLLAALFVLVFRLGWRNRSADPMSAVMLAAFSFYLLFSLFNTTILTSWNILMLVIPAAIIMKREATLGGATNEKLVTERGATPAGAHR